MKLDQQISEFKTIVFLLKLQLVLYENIDQILPNTSHGPMYYKIGV